MNIIHDGRATKEIYRVINLYDDDNRILFFETKEINGNYGWPNRRLMLELINGEAGDFLLITNDDNYYVPKFIEFMFEKINDKVGMVYCDMVHSHLGYDVLKGKLKVNHIDMGAFITEINLAKEVGLRHDCYEADGLFAEECAQRCEEKGLETIYVARPLFVHN